MSAVELIFFSLLHIFVGACLGLWVAGMLVDRWVRQWHSELSDIRAGLDE